MWRRMKNKSEKNRVANRREREREISTRHYGTQSCLWPKEQEPRLQQRNWKYRHCHPSRNMVQRRWTHWLPSMLQRADSPFHQTTRCETGKILRGMLICYRANLTHSIKLVKTATFYIWLEMNKEMILTEKNVLLYPPTRVPIL